MSAVMQALGWLGTAFVILAFWKLQKDNNVKRYNYCTIIGAVVLGSANGYFGAWFAVALNCFYGAIAVWGLITRRKEDQCESESISTDVSTTS